MPGAMSGTRRIGILTGGGDVHGLNSVIKSVVYRATENGDEVVGIRRGWEGLTHLRFAPQPDPHYIIRLDRTNTKGDDRMKGLSKRWVFGAATLALTVFAAFMVSGALAGAKDTPGAAKGLGQLTGLLPRDHLTEESAIQVDLSKETVRLPLYKGIAYKGTHSRRRSGTSCSTPPMPGSRMTSA